ncbi:Uma2 family endonuclease [Microseira sp. BLCC-F43]|jgi:Uma2 family endonuclease|uniref:Uma2 family endonuclease n=1 Tax=Microseira sp. BLCC-F43 TaxID=3153602 RepID=UPI0035B99699
MTAASQLQMNPIPEQKFVFPIRLSWEQFKTLEELFDYTRSIRLVYLDGQVEIVTVSTNRETFKSLIACLLMMFFIEKDISFTPTGSATLQAEERGSSKEPDLSYRFGEERRQRNRPDLVIEIVFTSGTVKKLEYYRRFDVPEVWFWEDGVFTVYRLQEAGYEQVTASQILPELDLGLLAQCLQMAEEKEAMKYFRNAIQNA